MARSNVRDPHYGLLLKGDAFVVPVIAVWVWFASSTFARRAVTHSAVTGLGGKATLQLEHWFGTTFHGPEVFWVKRLYGFDRGQLKLVVVDSRAGGCHGAESWRPSAAGWLSCFHVSTCPRVFNLVDATTCGADLAMMVRIDVQQVRLPARATR